MSTSNTTKSLILSPPASAIDTYEEFVMREHSVHPHEGSPGEERGRCQVTIYKLSDDVLLGIFDFYRRTLKYGLPGYGPWGWQRLAHVCRRWRSIIFASPQRLELRVSCDGFTPTRTSLDIWPLFPIAVAYPRWLGHHPGTVVDDYRMEENVIVALEHKMEENVIAALENHDRITHIRLADWSGSALRRFVALMLEPFVALTHLALYYSKERTAPILPEAFLGGSALRLRSFNLEGIAFPSLPRFFISSDLVHLSLEKTPTSGYISPEALTAYLAPLFNLKTLSIGFSSPRPRPNQPISPTLARVVLPALTDLFFRGVSEYLEDFISRIDTPALDHVDTHFSMDLDFHIPQLNQLIARVERFKQPNRAALEFDTTMVRIHLRGQAILYLKIYCDKLDYQVSSMTQMCRELSPYLSFVEKLDIFAEFPALQNDMDSTQWLELFHPFIAVQSLRVTKKLAPLVAPALQELTGDRASEVLPALRDLHLGEFETSGSLREAIQPFVTARQLSDHPVALEFGEFRLCDDDADTKADE